MAKQAEHGPSLQGAEVPSESPDEETGTESIASTEQGSSTTTPTETIRSRGPGLAELLGFSAQGYPVVGLRGVEEAFEAPTAVALTDEDVGAMVLVSFVDGRDDQPVITGQLQPPRSASTSSTFSSGSSSEPSAASLSADGPMTVDADGETVTIEAKKELILRCGKASVRLRRDGRVEVRGIDVVSRAERANWIKGGSVALN